MQVISLSAHFDGRSIQVDEPYPLQPNTKLIVTILPEQLAEREAWFNFSKNQLNIALPSRFPQQAIAPKSSLYL